MEADVLNALQCQPAFFPGGRDRDGRPLILVPVPSELQPWTKRYLETAIKYLLSTLSVEEGSADGTARIESARITCTIVIDTQRCQFRLARTTIRHIESLIDASTTTVIVVRPDVFWDKQLVENCTKSHKKGEPITIPKSRIFKYFEANELPEELGGTLPYNHEQWLSKRVRIEEFKRAYDKANNDLENLHVVLLENKSIRANETEQALKTCSYLNGDVQRTIRTIIENGSTLVAELTDALTQSSGRYQDLIEARESLKRMLNEIEARQTSLAAAWSDLEKSIDLVRELATLEEGVTFVTNWILGSAELLLNVQQKIGCDVPSCEDLRREHESLEMQCCETYGFYAELLHKIKILPIQTDTFAHKDLMSQKEFMDFVCRSFATRLERRRNVLIASSRFYRLVSEYFDRTSEVFESLVMGNKVDDFDVATGNLQKLKDSQMSLDHVIKELEKEGEKLSDVLSMPVKDALGRDIGVDYTDDIATIRDILDATIARRNIFIDSVELQKLTLEQVTHVHTYENDAFVAIQWLDDLYTVMIKTHSHVGCNVYEIQMQKEELQTFQETAKGTYNYGCQLLDAALALRQSCKLSVDKNREWLQHLNRTWKSMQTVSQEQMTRLRVSAVFHRSIEDQCAKLNELRVTVQRLIDIDVAEAQRSSIRKYLLCRERLLVEVGRMVRLGRLLKTRLKEPFNFDMDTDAMTDSGNGATVPPAFLSTSSGNFIACDAISSKLTEVSKIAESLDFILKELQDCLDAEEASSTATVSEPQRRLTVPINDSKGSGDEWNSSFKSSTNTTEDEAFVTASEGTLQSRSSYRTASDGGGGTSPWWTVEKHSLDADSSDVDPEAPTMQLLSGVISSASVSFDDSEHSFLSAQQSPSFAESTAELSPIGLDAALRSTLNDRQDNELISGQNVAADIAASKVSNVSAAADDSGNGSSVLTDGISTWGSYCNTIITKQTIKRCL